MPRPKRLIVEVMGRGGKQALCNDGNGSEAILYGALPPRRANSQVSRGEEEPLAPVGVSAKFWTSDKAYEIKFDVTDFMTDLDEDEARELDNFEWERGSLIDSVVWFYEDRLPALKQLLAYCTANKVEYRVSVDAEQARSWLRSERPRFRLP